MQDTHYGHRDWFTGDVIGDSKDYIEWDYALLAAYQIIQDHTDEDGILAWDNFSENVYIGADLKIRKFKAAKHARTNAKRYKPQPGEMLVPNVELGYGEWPTYSEWRKSMVEDDDGTIE